VVPCVDNAAPDMLALRGRFFDTRSFSDIDRKFGLGPVVGFHQHNTDNESEAIEGFRENEALEVTNLVCSTFRVVARDDILTEARGTRPMKVGTVEKSRKGCTKRM
jgi:hypothetical protein